NLIAYRKRQEEHRHNKADTEGVVRQCAERLPSDTRVVTDFINSTKRNERIGSEEKARGHVLPHDVKVDARVKDDEEGYDLDTDQLERVGPHGKAYHHEYRPSDKYAAE